MTVAELARALVLMAGTSNPEFVERARSAARLVASESAMAGVNPLAVTAIAFRESSLNPKAVGRHGEKGLMQIKPDADAARHCRGFNLDDSRANVRCGVRLLRRALRQCGNLEHALARYNGSRCGPSRYASRVLETMSRAGRSVSRASPGGR